MENLAEVISEIVQKIHKTLKKFPTCRIGLAGGKTPRQLYEKLAQQNLPWERIQLVLIDERCVPPNHEQSNFRMLNETLFSKIKIEPENIFAFNTFLSPEEAVNKLQGQLENLRRERHPLFDILILGMGVDGHIASLFPNSQALESSRLVTTSQTEHFEIKNRLTLTFESLLDSDEIILLIHGEEKTNILEKAGQPNADFHELPIAKILQGKPVKIFE